MPDDRVLVIADVKPTVPAQHYDLESRRIASAPIANALKASRVDMQPAGRADPHVHADAEQLFIVLQGEMALKIEGREFHLKPGEAALVQPGEMHENFNVYPGLTQYLVISTPVARAAGRV